MKAKLFFFAIFTFLVLSGSVSATTRYVSLTGSHTPPYTSLATAANDIQSAVTASVNGDLILVDDGTYLLTTRIPVTKGVTIRSINGATFAIVDGNGVTKCFEINHVDAVLDGLTVRNGYNPSSFGGGIQIISGGTVQWCIITDNQARDGGGVAIDNSGLVQFCRIYDNLASDNGSSGYGGGVRLLNGGDVMNCEVYDNVSVKYGGGINIWNSGNVYNCVLVHNNAPNGAGIRTRNNGKVYNSIIYDNTGGVNYEVSGSGYHYYHCCTSPALPAGYSTNCISTPPLFVSMAPGSEDFHLQAASPCIDAGLNQGWMATATDLDGNPRIVNGVVDMGCYEYAIPAPVDTDGDGVPDVDDDYPTDPDRAFNCYFPASGYGTLAYEDLWPGTGDYDFNDLVCDYRFKTVTNASNHVVEIFGSFIIKAFGAHLHNGFGFQFPNDLVSAVHLTVSGYDILPGGYILLDANGLESGQTKPTFIVYDDAYRLMSHPGTGTGVNTDPDAPFVTPDTVNLTIGFTSAIYTIAQVGISQFNPFLIVDKNRELEVHLPDYPPTSLANPAYFGMAQDDSNPGIDRYYKTANNLPWAINIAESFAYPIEKIQIVHAYHHFAEWAESNGALFPDWYQDNPGYRNASLIY